MPGFFYLCLFLVSLDSKFHEGIDCICFLVPRVYKWIYIQRGSPNQCMLKLKYRGKKKQFSILVFSDGKTIAHRYIVISSRFQSQLVAELEAIIAHLVLFLPHRITLFPIKLYFHKGQGFKIKMFIVVARFKDLSKSRSHRSFPMPSH